MHTFGLARKAAKRRLLGMLLWIVVPIVPPSLFGLQQGSGQPAAMEFEVASIKPSPPGAVRVGVQGGPGTSDPSLWRAENITISDLVTYAYRIKRSLVSGPDWMATEHFNIEAKVPAGATKEDLRLMVRSLLERRFRMAAHQGIQTAEVYQLSIAKGGPKFKRAPDEVTTPESRGEPARVTPSEPPNIAIDKNGFAILQPGGPKMMVLGDRFSFRATQESMEQFMGMLSTQVDRPVVDATGLKSKYDFTLFWRREHNTAAAVPSRPNEAGVPPGPPPEEAGPTLFIALQEQLGLKLSLQKQPMETLIIDHLQKTPTEN